MRSDQPRSLITFSISPIGLDHSSCSNAVGPVLLKPTGSAQVESESVGFTRAKCRLNRCKSSEITAAALTIILF